MNSIDLDIHIAMNDFCRAHKIKFFSTSTSGLCSRYFSDLGETFIVKDRDGKTPKEYMIDHVELCKESFITLTKDAIC